MNIQKVREIIQLYKEHFSRVHQEEIYKWRITAHFQEHWDLDAGNFYGMVSAALATSTNLLASGNYFARRMLLGNAQKNPEEIRQLFIELYDEERDLLDRMRIFRENFRNINGQNFPGKMPYQDDRAIMVYLSLRYPNIYYLYKYTMFKDFVALVEYPYRPVMGRLENVTEYLTLCNLLNAEIRADYKLLEMHQTRIGEKEFADPEYHILTQDLVYAATFHFPRFQLSATQAPALDRLKRENRTLSPRKDSPPVLKGSFTNYIDLEREKKRIGDLGELLVLQREREKLRALGIRREPEHKSKSEGDGLGYDILSYDENGNELFIEVKTTTGSFDKAFFVTRNELQRSVQDADKFVLYRLYDFDISNMTANYHELPGDLTSLCVNPILFRVVVED